MAWPSPGSAIFTQAAANPFLGGTQAVTAPGGWTFGTTTLNATTSLMCALYGNAGTPDKDAAVASTGYNTGAWVTGNESSATTGYTAGGQALTSVTWPNTAAGAPATLTVKAANPSWTVTGTLTAFGDLVYYNNATAGGTVIKQGFALHYFGGSQSVTGGTFTVQWPTVNSVTGTVLQFSFAYA